MRPSAPQSALHGDVDGAVRIGTTGPRPMPRTRRLNPARNATGTPDIHDALRERIVAVDLPPGASLSETRVAAHYGVSRTPVREALKRLAEEGLLEVIPQVGTFVARIDLGLVRGNLFVRETLECRIVELAAERIAPAGTRLLKANLARQREAVEQGKQMAFFQADEALHRLLAELAGQPAAWSVIHAAKNQLDRVRRLSLGDQQRTRHRLREHGDIIDRVMRHDGAGASAAMRAHVRSALDAVTQIAERQPDYFVPVDRPDHPSEQTR